MKSFLHRVHQVPDAAARCAARRPREARGYCSVWKPSPVQRQLLLELVQQVGWDAVLVLAPPWATAQPSLS